MRPMDVQSVKILTNAHLELLRGGRIRPAHRRSPRTN